MYEFDIPDMSCGHCVGSVTKAIKSVDPEAIAEVDLMKRKAMITTKADPKTIGTAIEDAGYPTSFITA